MNKKATNNNNDNNFDIVTVIFDTNRHKNRNNKNCNKNSNKSNVNNYKDNNNVNNNNSLFAINYEVKAQVRIHRSIFLTFNFNKTTYLHP